MSCIFNAYIPGEGPYEKIPEDRPPGSGGIFSSLLGPGMAGGVQGLLGRFHLDRLDSGDLLLLLILVLLLREGDRSDAVTVLAIAAVLLLTD